jgi:hypothetical protein
LQNFPHSPHRESRGEELRNNREQIRQEN